MSERNIGFYHWDGDPCRIRRDDETDALVAEIYVSGKGFLPVELGDLMLEGIAISEDEFKKLVAEEISLHRKAP